VKPARRNHALWLGPLLTFAGGVTYFTTFARWAPLRDFPWVNLPLVLGGLLLSAAGLRRAWRTAPRRRTRALAVAGCAGSGLLATLFCLYVFALSYALPAPGARTLALEQAPDFALLDQRGESVRLSALRGRKVVLTFYRGFW
jgi:hypothetical protein